MATVGSPIGLLLVLTYASGDAAPAPTPEPEAVVAAAVTDGGFDKFMEEFARERARERQLRENEEIMRIAAFEEEFLINLLKRLL